MQYKKTTYRLKFLLPFSLLLTLLPIGDLQAQRHNNRQVIRAYPSIGFTASQIRGDELKGFKKFGLTAGVGALVSLTDNEMWSLSLEANYVERGSFNNTNDPYSITGLALRYVDIPLGFHFTDPYGGMTIGTGLIYSRLVQQPHGQIYYTPNYFEPDSSDMSFLKNDFSAFIDFRFTFWRGLTLNVRFQHSLIPIKKDWHFTEYSSLFAGGSRTWANDLYNSSVSVRILYVFGEPLKAKKVNKKKPMKRR